ncbi:MAG: flagellin lysine-N-methylase [Ruminococcus sp.]|nr:flagellin lysine-N-methylase [Ruminococcus sp.]
MKVIRPDFWNRFQCIGGVCSDNCCIGWEICIDEESLEKYRQVEGAIGERLKTSIRETDGESSFCMCNGRCAFLNEDNLCDLIIGIGEDSLCDICREHPRFYEEFGVREEAGLGLCCEEAVRLLLEKKEPLRFEEIENEEEEEEPYFWFEELDAVRTVIFDILQNRQDVWEDRLHKMMFLTEQIQGEIDKENPDGIWEILDQIEKKQMQWKNQGDTQKETVDNLDKNCKQEWISIYEALLAVFLKMEVLDVNWKNRLLHLKEHLEEFYENRDAYRKFTEEISYEREHLAVYQIFRYFLKGIDDEDILSKCRMAVVADGMIQLLHMDTWKETGTLTLQERIFNIKAYSKELEYCPENLEMLMDALWDEKFSGLYIL